jgi:glycosyltransferase involved in cell wall biosynthesis
LDTILSTAAAVITTSSTTLQALSTYAVSRGLVMPPATSAPLAAAASKPDSSQRPLRESYFVMLSTIEPRKNHWMILQVWRRLIERYGADAPRLVVVGQRGWECENALDLLERCDLLRGFVLEKPVCCDAELVTYLRHAQALLFPSFVEGYGLPLVEALTLGVPAIASELPVFREIADDVPEYLDPLDAIGWMKCIESFCQPDSPMRTAQLLRMTKFTPPTWATHFEAFEQLLTQVR